MNTTISSEEFLEIAKNLQIHHAIFDRFWSISRPNFTEDIPTAAVYFDKIGETIDFRINPIFWESLSLTQKQFVISHECLHTILYHGFRINNLKSNELLKANLALDIIVNHSLVNNFSFIREEVDPIGGTTFSCIENYIQNYMAKHKVAYPKAVFVITDGYGNSVNPVKPQNWYWFIDGSPYLVPKQSHHFNLKEYE